MEAQRKFISRVDSSYEVIGSKAKKLYEKVFAARKYINKVISEANSKGTRALINDNFQGPPVGGGINTVNKVLDDLEAQLLLAQTCLNSVYHRPEASDTHKQLKDTIRHLNNLENLMSSGRPNEVLGLLGMLLKNLDVIKNMPSLAKTKKDAESLLKTYESL